MTKVYLVRSVRVYDNGRSCIHIESVFTNKKLAENYAKWIEKTPLKQFRSEPKFMQFYIETREICRTDYSNLPY